jgi:hypothetical protein
MTAEKTIFVAHGFSDCFGGLRFANPPYAFFSNYILRRVLTRDGIRWLAFPDCAALHPGYEHQHKKTAT